MRSENEKIDVCTKFLRDRGFFVGSRLMTVEELAEYLSLSAATVRSLPIRVMTVGVSKLAPRYRYREEDVRAWVEANTSEATLEKAP
jgi:hypothetical protein